MNYIGRVLFCQQPDRRNPGETAGKFCLTARSCAGKGKNGLKGTFWNDYVCVKSRGMPPVSVLRGGYNSSCPLMISLKWSPSAAAARRHSSMRVKKISKYSITAEIAVSMSSLSRKVFFSTESCVSALVTA